MCRQSTCSFQLKRMCQQDMCRFHLKREPPRRKARSGDKAITGTPKRTHGRSRCCVRKVGTNRQPATLMHLCPHNFAQAVLELSRMKLNDIGAVLHKIGSRRFIQGPRGPTSWVRINSPTVLGISWCNKINTRYLGNWPGMPPRSGI